MNSGPDSLIHDTLRRLPVGHADLVIAGTVLFLVFATVGLLVSARGVSPSSGGAPLSTTPDADRKPLPLLALTVLAGLLCGLAVLAFSCC